MIKEALIALLSMISFVSLASAVDFPDIYENFSGVKEIRAKIHNDSDKFTFRLIGDNKENKINKIQVITPSGVVQTIEPEMEETPPKGSKYFILEDLDFDGYKDLKILSMWGATGNLFYKCWLYDPKEAKFIFDEALSDMGNPLPHPESKTLTTRSTGGMAGCIFIEETYIYKDGKPVVIETIDQDYDQNDEQLVRTVRKRIHGELKIVSLKKKAGRREEFSGYPSCDQIQTEPHKK